MAAVDTANNSTDDDQMLIKRIEFVVRKIWLR